MMSNLIGQSLGRYHILEQIGEGGMATVYKAYDTRLERDVAIKILRTDQFAPAVLERILKRFEREAKALAKLSHPNIVKVHDYGEHEGAPYLVLEFLPGGTLKQKLGQHIPWREAVRLILPVAHALEYAHDNGVIHRDIKPSNILLTHKGSPLLSDFGIAKLLENEDTQTLTASGVGIGTPEYMAPEQGVGQESDGRADIYSLGIVLYELITGRKPFEGNTPMAIILKQMSEPLPKPTRYVKDLPRAVESLLSKALAKQPENRFADMSVFVSTLEELLASSSQPEVRSILHRNKDTLATIVQDSQNHPRSEELPVLAKKPRSPNRKRKWILGFGITTGLLGLVVLAGWLLTEFPIASRIGEMLTPMPAPIIGHIQSSGGQAAVRSSPDGEVIGSIPDGAEVEIQWDRPVFLNGEMWVRVTARTSSGNVDGWVLFSLIASSPTANITPLAPQGEDGMPMVFVPEGFFTMGSDTGEPDEQPKHLVYLDAYWIDQYEATKAMYARCVQVGACQPALLPTQVATSIPMPTPTAYPGMPNFDNYPVTYVTWYGANEYCIWMGRRLPTEAEWEKAARGIDGRTYPWGEGIDCDHANLYGCARGLMEVGRYELGKSPYGVYDMAGNVQEWVADWYFYDYYSISPFANPLGYSSGYSRAVRGGSWGSDGNVLRPANRNGYDPSVSDYNLGFRCALSH